MKNKTIWISLVILIVIAIGIWWARNNSGNAMVKGVCDPWEWKDKHVTCPGGTCTGTCYLKTRKKGSEDDWKNPKDDFPTDTTNMEYKCVCK